MKQRHHWTWVALLEELQEWLSPLLHAALVRETALAPITSHTVTMG